MKKVCLALALCLLIAVSAAASPEDIVAQAVAVLKDSWKGLYEDIQTSQHGHLEIVNTRIITIKDDPAAAGYISGDLEEKTQEMFGDIDKVVEFILYSDYYGSAPYYENVSGPRIADCVIVYRDGRMEGAYNPFNMYRRLYANTDFSGIIARIDDLGHAYNEAFDLLDE